jgi:Asp-tRNA(Asn)/Glu-tRNA(Gln) amidotransferase A subunit family amidase
MFNRWTSGLLVPCVSLPGFAGPQGLPVGVQLIAAMGDDHRLLRAAKWISSRIGDATDNA